MKKSETPIWRSTTVIAVHKDGQVALGADGQLSLGDTIVKGNANKIRRMNFGGHDALAGFAGAGIDALALFDRLETKMEAHPGKLKRACFELTRDWRTERSLRRFNAMLIVADKDETFLLSGTGDVIEPQFGTIAIGSGGNYALAAARALMDQNFTATEIAKRSLTIAADICIYTNHSITVESIT